MSNPIYQQMNNNMIQQFRQFQQTFKGNPQTVIQQMMNSGKISQSQYNQAVQMANQFKGLLGQLPVK